MMLLRWILSWMMAMEALVLLLQMNETLWSNQRLHLEELLGPKEVVVPPLLNRPPFRFLSASIVSVLLTCHVLMFRRPLLRCLLYYATPLHWLVLGFSQLSKGCDRHFMIDVGIAVLSLCTVFVTQHTVRIHYNYRADCVRDAAAKASMLKEIRSRRRDFRHVPG